MTFLKKKLARLSLCPCGFPLLKTEIELGQEYEIPRFNLVGVNDTLICGGCGNETTVHLLAVRRDGGSLQWLPKEIFDWD